MSTVAICVGIVVGVIIGVSIMEWLRLRVTIPRGGGRDE